VDADKGNKRRRLGTRKTGRPRRGRSLLSSGDEISIKVRERLPQGEKLKKDWRGGKGRTDGENRANSYLSRDSNQKENQRREGNC